MNDKDLLQRFLFEKAPVRGQIVHLNQSLQTILTQHNYPPHIQQLLGQALIAASLLGATIKYNGRLTIQFRGKGKIKLLLAQCNQDFHLRGLVEWDESLTAEETPAAFQDGILAILMDPEIEGGRRYQGIVEWKGSSLTESIENYFLQSEQLPTRLWLAVDEKFGAGLMLQVMPKENPEVYHHDWEHLTILANTITAPELLTLDNETILKRLFAAEDVRVFEQVPVIFRCHCSSKRGEQAISLLGKEEIEEELRNNQNITVTCEFCNHQYVYDRVDIANIFQKGNKSAGSSELQ